METLWKIAARNVLRHKRRTLITGIVMTMGIGMFITMDSMLIGMDRLTIDNMVDYTESFMKIRTPEYVNNLQGTPLDYGIPDPEGAIEAVLAADKRITAAAPRSRFVANVSNYEDMLPTIATVVDPARDGAVFRLADSMVSGAWLDTAEPGSVVLGAGLAEELSLEVGDYVVVSASTAFENVNADEYLVAGLVSSPMPEISNGGLFMTFATADQLLGTSGFVSEIVVATERMPNLKALLAASAEAAAKTAKALPGLRADPLTELAKDYLAMRAMKGKGSYFIIMVVLLIAAVGIVNTILMSVYARIREIGVLKAYGMSPKDIQRLFTLEGIIIGVVGSAGGVLFGTALVWWMSTSGMPMGAFVGKVDMGGLPLSGTLYGEWNPGSMVFGFCFGLVVAFIAARIPAKRASKMEVTDALRFV